MANGEVAPAAWGSTVNDRARSIAGQIVSWLAMGFVAGVGLAMSQSFAHAWLGSWAIAWR